MLILVFLSFSLFRSQIILCIDVRVTVIGQKKKSRVVRRCLNPKWQQPLDFEIPMATVNEAGHIVITFEVYDWDPFTSDDFIGIHKLKIDKGSENVCERWLRLFDEGHNVFSEVKLGRILVSIEVENLWL